MKECKAQKTILKEYFDYLVHYCTDEQIQEFEAIVIEQIRQKEKIKQYFYEFISEVRKQRKMEK